MWNQIFYNGDYTEIRIRRLEDYIQILSSRYEKYNILMRIITVIYNKDDCNIFFKSIFAYGFQ